MGLVRVLALALALVAPVGAQERDGHAAARARWERKSPEERAEIQRRFEELRAMDPERRRELERRLERLREMEADTAQELPAEVRERVSELDPEDRHAFLRGCAHQKLAEEGRGMRERLPDAVRERAEAMLVPVG